jgi:hypothetical protein
LRESDPALNANFGSGPQDSGKPGVFDSPEDVTQFFTEWMTPAIPFTDAAKRKPTDAQIQGYIDRLSPPQRTALYNGTIDAYNKIPNGLKKRGADPYFRKLWGALTGKKRLI